MSSRICSVVDLPEQAIFARLYDEETFIKVL